jgi:SpoVK/Ycf46/Vps4 family AAA+-type ATPase
VLGELLTHLDGMTTPAAVLTVATTNDTAAIDPALIRCGRFDVVIEIGPPDRDARDAILRRYLGGVAAIDPTAVAAVTDGATGADLREIVRRAVLERGAELTRQDLLDIVADGRWKPSPPVGQYL